MQDLGVFGVARRASRARRPGRCDRVAEAASAPARHGRQVDGGGMAMAKTAAADGGDGAAPAAPAGAGRRRDEEDEARGRSAAAHPPGQTDSRRSSPSSARTSPTPPSGPPPLTTGAGRHRRGRVHHAREPDHLEGQGLGDGPRHQGRPGRGRGRHDQGPARPAAGAAVLRREGRGRALGQRPQLAQDEEGGPGRRWSSTAACSQPLGETAQTVEIAAGGGAPRRLARQGRPRGRGRRPHEGAHRRGIRRDADDASRPTSTACSRPSPSPARSGPTRRRRRSSLRVPAERAARAVAARGPLLADPGRRDGRCPALPGRLPLRLHRADAQPLPADGHHAEGPDRHGARPEGDPREAHQPQRPGDRRRQASGPRSWKRLRAQPGLRRGRGRARWPQAGVQRLADMQLSDGGWGWFSGFGEHSSPHTTALVVHGLQVARQNDVALPAGHARARRRLAQELPGRAGPAARERRRARSSRTRSHADDLDALVYMVLADAGVAQRPRCATSSIATAPSSRSTPRRCSAWRWSKQRREGQAGDDPARTSTSTSSRTTRTRRPTCKLPERELLVVLVRQRDRDRRLLPQAAGPHRPQGRAGAAAGEVPAQQPQARHLLEHDARHGRLHRGDGRLPQGQRRGPARHDGRRLRSTARSARR